MYCSLNSHTQHHPYLGQIGEGQVRGPGNPAGKYLRSQYLVGKGEYTRQDMQGYSHPFALLSWSYFPLKRLRKTPIQKELVAFLTEAGWEMEV